MFVNQSVAARRRIFVRLTLASDATLPATDGAGAQPSLSVNGGASFTAGVGTLVAVSGMSGVYYTELTQPVISGLAGGDVLVGTVKSATSDTADFQVLMQDPAWVPPTATAVSDTVWGAGSRALTDKTGFAIAPSEHAAIGVATWATPNRLLTDLTGFELSPDGVDAIVADVWSAATRSLTDKLNFSLTGGERASIVAALLAHADMEALIATVLAFHVTIDQATGVMTVKDRTNSSTIYQRQLTRAQLGAVVASHVTP